MAGGVMVCKSIQFTLQFIFLKLTSNQTERRPFIKDKWSITVFKSKQNTIVLCTIPPQQKHSCNVLNISHIKKNKANERIWSFICKSTTAQRSEVTEKSSKVKRRDGRRLRKLCV